MKVFYSHGLDLNARIVFLDSDFLGILFSSTKVLDSFFGKYPSTQLIIDPLIEFEFIRDVFLPEQYMARKEFLNPNVFIPALDNLQIFKALEDNAINLSRIYKHQQVKSSSSTVDLFLAARLMHISQYNPLFITGNSKDFPSCVFEVKGIITTYLEKESASQSWNVLSFSKEKFIKCYKELEKIQIK